MKFVKKFRKSPQDKQISALFKEWDKQRAGSIIHMAASHMPTRSTLSLVGHLASIELGTPTHK